MKQNRKVIVITGGIATGKTTVAQYLKKRGYTVIDADELVRFLYQKGEKVYLQLVELVGDTILNDACEIDRRKLTEYIFENEDHLKSVNRIVHQAVVQEINNRLKKEAGKNVFLDIPLMIEEKEKLMDYGLNYDEIWLVYANEETQVNRLLKRDDRDPDKSMMLLRSQMPIKDKKEQSDKVLYNMSSLEDLYNDIDDLLKEIH
jgi:dephospho-CoA kinase